MNKNTSMGRDGTHGDRANLKKPNRGVCTGMNPSQRMTMYRESHPEYNKQRLRKVRQLVLAKYGGKCIRCGYSDWRALQIDHINGGGHKERKDSGGSESYYRRILKDDTGKYQLLCANCNWIKRYERNEN